MGCISSKVMARSLSLHEERKKGSQRTSNNGIPLLEDIIKSANNSSDHYLAQVLHYQSFSSNAASKLAIDDQCWLSHLEGASPSQGSEPRFESLLGEVPTFSAHQRLKQDCLQWRPVENRKKLAIDDEPASSETTDKLEIPISLDDPEEPKGGKQICVDKRKRSKSCHLFLPENSSGFGKKYDFTNELWLNSTGVVSKVQGSEFEPKLAKEDKYKLYNRSFHTMEEYDNLIRKLGHECTDKDDDDGSLGSNNMDLLVSESAVSSTTHDHTEDKIVPCQTHDMSIEKGYKRRAIAERLESLRIPSNNTEFPAIASLREWITPPGNIYSPGSYVTPKFGSYSSSSLVAAGRNNNNNNNAGESHEHSSLQRHPIKLERYRESSEHSSIFSPELVNAFEQCMKNLEVEEEDILREIIENFEEENGGQNNEVAIETLILAGGL